MRNDTEAVVDDLESFINNWQLPTYAVGTVAAFWTVQRVAAFL